MRPRARAGVVATAAMVIALVPQVARAAPPSNDDFADRLQIVNLQEEDGRDTSEATVEPGEPVPSCQPTQPDGTVWYSFTPSGDVTVSASTFASDYDTVLGLWTGPSLDNLSEVACNDEGPLGDGTSKLTVGLTMGTEYLVQVLATGGAGTLTFQFAVHGAISGRVTDWGTGEPLADCTVEAFHHDNSWESATATTSPDGTYTLSARPGSHAVEFKECADPHQSQWYDGEPDSGSADTVTVDPDASTNDIDARLLPVGSGTDGSISGTVTDEDTGDGIDDVCAFANSNLDEVIDFTDAGGDYTLEGLSAGEYFVGFADCASSTRYVSEQHPDPVMVGGDVEDIDIHLDTGTSISGTVTDEGSGTPIADICVESSNGLNLSVATTDANGDYTVGGLTADPYTVRFTVESMDPRLACSTLPYREEWYDDATEEGSAEPVTGPATDIDASLPLTGAISGTVTDDDTGSPLEGICVQATTDTEDFGPVQTDASGVYTLSGLPGGEHAVHFTDCAPAATYVQEWYDDEPNEASADAVSVTALGTTTGIDAALAVGGSISGTVTEDATGDPLEGICPEVYDLSGELVATAQPSGPNGVYTVTGLPTGSFKVVFSSCFPAIPDAPVVAEEWFDDEPDEGSADAISITAPSVTSGIDAALTVGGAIFGQVVEEGTMAPLDDICVEVFDGPGSLVTEIVTGDDGSYDTGPMPSGSYKLHYTPCGDSPHFDEWFENQSSQASADPVVVTSPDRTFLNLVELAPGSTLTVDVAGTGTGSVASSPGGVACPGDCAQLYEIGETVTLTATPTGGSSFAGWSGACTNPTGTCGVTMSEARSVTATFTAPGGGPGPGESGPGGPSAKSLTLSGPAKVKKGAKATLTATLASCTGATRNDMVTFMRGGAALGTVPVDGSCTATLTKKVTKTSSFTATSPADGDSLAATSNEIKVKVKKKKRKR